MNNNTRTVIICLTLTSLVALSLGAWLCSRGYQGSELFASAGISGIGALSALLSKTDRQPVSEVKVTNTESNPVPTTDTK